MNKGELLFLNQFTKHEILKAGQNDIAINFMVLPEFFDVAYSMTGNDNMLADFLVNVLRQDEERGEYLHFKVAEVLQIQNLLENIIYSLVNGEENREQMCIRDRSGSLKLYKSTDDCVFINDIPPVDYSSLCAGKRISTSVPFPGLLE